MLWINFDIVKAAQFKYTDPILNYVIDSFTTNLTIVSLQYNILLGYFLTENLREQLIHFNFLVEKSLSWVSENSQPFKRCFNRQVTPVFLADMVLKVAFIEIEFYTIRLLWFEIEQVFFRDGVSKELLQVRI